MQVFEGPLDLLLEEVRRQNVAIEDIAMAPMVAGYLGYVRSAAALHWQLGMEWLHMAATLIEWKSRALLPRPAQADPIRDRLVERLIAHRREAAKDLEWRLAIENGRFTRAAEAREDESRPDFLSAWDLLHQARELARWAAQKRIEVREFRASLTIEPDDVPIAAVILELQEQVNGAGGSMDLTSSMMNEPRAAKRMAMFLAALEMAKERHADLIQDAAFTPIELRVPAQF